MAPPAAAAGNRVTLGIWAAAILLAMVLHSPAPAQPTHMRQPPFDTDTEQLSLVIEEMLLNATQTLQGPKFSNITAPDRCVTFPTDSWTQEVDPWYHATTDALELAQQLEWIANEWNVPQNLSHTAGRIDPWADECIDTYIDSLRPRDPVVMTSLYVCRIECKAKIDACGVCGGTSYPNVAVHGRTFNPSRNGPRLPLLCSCDGHQ